MGDSPQAGSHSCSEQVALQLLRHLSQVQSASLGQSFQVLQAGVTSLSTDSGAFARCTRALGSISSQSAHAHPLTLTGQSCHKLISLLQHKRGALRLQ